MLCGCNLSFSYVVVMLGKKTASQYLHAHALRSGCEAYAEALVQGLEAAEAHHRLKLAPQLKAARHRLEEAVGVPPLNTSVVPVPSCLSRTNGRFRAHQAQTDLLSLRPEQHK